jgi:hypothetical protein
MTATGKSRSLGKQIKAQFCDGKWHCVETIASRTGVPTKKVWSTLDRMWRWGTYKTKCERKKVGTEHHFRLSPKEKQISVHEVAIAPGAADERDKSIDRVAMLSQSQTQVAA